MTIAVLIPAYNEEATIGNLVTKIKAIDSDLKIYVIDDGSTDNTAINAQEHGAEVVRHPINLGGGAAIRTGLTLCLLKEIKFAITLDADGQHDPGEIPKLLETIEREEAGLVVGSRFLKHNELTMRRYRSIGVRFFSWCTSLLTGMQLTDATSCYRVYDLDMIRGKIESLSENQYYSIETLLRLAQAGAKIVEVEIQDIPRLQGSSKKGILSYMYNLLRVILRLTHQTL